MHNERIEKLNNLIINTYKSNLTILSIPKLTSITEDIISINIKANNVCLRRKK